MIQTDKLIFVENPRTGSSAIADVLMEKLGGFRLTPRHAPLFDPVEDRVVFTVVRNPVYRWVSMWKYMKESPEQSFSDWMNSENPLFQQHNQSYWTQNCDVVLKYEELPTAFNDFMESQGYPDVKLPVHKQTKFEKIPPSYSRLLTKAFPEEFSVDKTKKKNTTSGS